MNFYIASGLQNKEAVRMVSDKLKQIGWHHTYDWTQNERANSLEELQTIGMLEKQAVVAADVVVVLLPGGKGTHIELGMAIAKKKRIFLFDSSGEVMNVPTTSTFYHLPEITICTGSIDELITIVLNENIFK
ncbi:nucleoside 2-deoxyribosyltransferase [Paenisporosarcina indica]|uniref:nucleoside 2-deoxyribosyltransferase n=1 Tax=Paenisporosarcina indica TaxID=650093 RepID=UPI000950009A|nr:nucleoside 2-deoxyribosyltransferase [Paenisporosarcina indica]